MSPMTYKLRHVVCIWRSQILRKKILHAFAMGENEYAFLCTLAAFSLSKWLKFQFFIFFNGIYENLPFKNYATVWWLKWRISYDMSSAHGEANFCEKKMLHAFAMGENEYAFLCTATAFCCQNHWNFIFSFFNGIYETMPSQNYATLWCRAWCISYDMSSAHDKDKFCEKKI